MKFQVRYIGILLLITGLLFGCGHSKKEKQQRAQARRDSIQKARRDSLQRVRKQRQDSLAKAQARADSIAKAKKNEQITLSQHGNYTIQVASWRSREKAQQQADIWKKRGFKHAYVVQHGDTSTGNVWFRVRLGRVDSLNKAKKVQQKLQKKYQAKSWVAGVH